MLRQRLITEINLVSLKLRDSLQSNFFNEAILPSTLEERYGGAYLSHKAARIIQRAYRRFKLNQTICISSLLGNISENNRNYSMKGTIDYAHFENDISRFQFGDMLSTKCDEDLENCQNDSYKTDSAEDSDSSSSFQDCVKTCKLPPPMPVITTGHLSTKSDLRMAQMKLVTLDNLSSTNTDNAPFDDKHSFLKPVASPHVTMESIGGIQSTRSQRDSGVSSHSSNTDLLAMEYCGQIISGLYSQKVQSFSNAGTTKCSPINDEAGSEYDCIPDDNYSLFDCQQPAMPLIMTSSKDSGVDADSSSGVPNPPHHLRKLSFQEKPLLGNVVRRQSVSTISGAMSSAETIPSSPWMKVTDSVVTEAQYNELVNRVMYRVAVNLFNRNPVIGFKFMATHQIVNVRCPLDVANFLRSREINRHVLADFLSCRNSLFHLQVLRCFLQCLPLENLSFLEAFHMFISSFKMPNDSHRTEHLVTEFCQYYTCHIQKCVGIDFTALFGLCRIIILLRSSIIRSRLIGSNSSVLSFSDFVKYIQDCFKAQRVPYNMEMLQNIYINITQSCDDISDLADNLIGRIDNIADHKPKSTVTSKPVKTHLNNGYLHESYRRITYCCDVQQSKIFGKKLNKKEHVRSIFVFNDIVVVAKRVSRISKPSKSFRMDSRFRCKAIIDLLSYQVSKVTIPGALYQIKMSSFDDVPVPNHSYIFVCENESNRDKLLSKIVTSQLESLCIEQLRMKQWNCGHNNRNCVCLSIIKSRFQHKIRTTAKVE